MNLIENIMVNISYDTLIKLIDRNPLNLLDIHDDLTEEQRDFIISQSSNIKSMSITDWHNINHDEKQRFIELCVIYKIKTGLIPLDYYINNHQKMPTDQFSFDVKEKIKGKDIKNYLFDLIVLGPYLEYYVNPEIYNLTEITLLKIKDFESFEMMVRFLNKIKCEIKIYDANEDDFCFRTLSLDFMFNHLDACQNILIYNNLFRSDENTKFAKIIDYFLKKQNFNHHDYGKLYDMVNRFPSCLDIDEEDMVLTSLTMFNHLHDHLIFKNEDDFLSFCFNHIHYAEHLLPNIKNYYPKIIDRILNVLESLRLLGIEPNSQNTREAYYENKTLNNSIELI